MRTTGIITSILLGPLATNASPIQTNPLYQQYGLPDNEYGATVLAYLYSYPLTQFIDSFRGPLGLAALGLNKLFFRSELATADSTTVVRQNVDTVYGGVNLDLSSSDVVFTVPPYETDRFTLFGFYDPFGTVYASVGSAEQDPPGKYLLRASPPSSKPGRSTDDCTPEYIACINSPTQNGVVILRVEARDQADIDIVTSYADQVIIEPVNQHEPTAKALSVSDLLGLAEEPIAQSLILAARLGSRNPPQDEEFECQILQVLEKAGVSNGRYEQPASVNMTEVQEEFDRRLMAYSEDPARITVPTEGWNLGVISSQGTYDNGKDITGRSFYALTVYLANTPAQALYANTLPATISLDSEEAYIATFSGPPQLPEDGFWSLTIYDDKGYLIMNPQDKYAIGDRTPDLTYPDGSKVNTDGSAARNDSEFQILIQPQNIPPPTNWTGNWLPAPAAGQGFQLTMRIYHPTEEFINGTYAYPTLVRQGLIRG